jgi:chromosome segregation ATPase
MIKKAIVGGGVVLLAGLFFFGRDCFSYIRTSVHSVKESVHSSVPVEFQIERARGMIKDLVPEIRKNMHVIAKEEVEVERLEKQIADSQARLAREKEELLKLKADVASAKKSFQYGGRTYTVDQVRTDLANRFERYKTGEATLASLEEMRGARQKSVDAARQKLEGMLASRRQLQVDVENLEARSQMVAAAQTTSNYNFDDSQLGRVKELVSDLRTRLDVSERLIAAEGTFHDEIPVDHAAPANVVEEITRHFAVEQPGGKPEASTATENKPEATKLAKGK